MKRVDLVSVSGGKDSQAVVQLALKNAHNPVFVFADTGHEHQQTYEHLDTMESEYRIKIRRVRADFSDRIAGKRKFIVEGGRGKPGWIESGVPQERIDRALAILKPTGNPFVDLCLWKGRFPSTKTRFCTEFLKSEPIEKQVVLPLLRAGQWVWSWQGVRADESRSRAKLTTFELADPGVLIYRPILHWKADQVFESIRRAGKTYNPLYEQGMGRVGCMPCINCRKGELREIASRFPEEIDRVREWEAIVSQAAKPASATLLPTALTAGRGEKNVDHLAHGIDAAVEWSRTTRGGRQFDLVPDDDPAMCSSLYGLCE